MARITHFNPPADVAALLGDTLSVNKASKFASASAYPTNHKLKPVQPKMRWSNPYNMGHVADWLIQFGPASWRDGSRPSLRTEILNGIARRSFAAEFWTAPAPVTDRIEVAYPTVDRTAHPPPDPADPLDTANTDCDYSLRSAYWPFSQASAGGWPPLPGWAGAIDANRYFVDTWHAQRSLTYPFPKHSVGDERGFVLIHLQGSISANAEESGLKLWFTPSAAVHFFSYQSSADGFSESIAENWAFLYDGNLAIPPTNLGWSHTQPVDLVFQLGANLSNGWSKTTGWLNLKLSTRAPCGIYRASNAWAECRVNLNVQVYRPSFLT
ncbi:MAG: hypothetical protein EOM92_13460 [Gammaproteobacteria bacterium]|nr:hypothetical protein [Gammaproteobacteria bacterium]